MVKYRDSVLFSVSCCNGRLFYYHFSHKHAAEYRGVCKHMFLSVVIFWDGPIFFRQKHRQCDRDMSHLYRRGQKRGGFDDAMARYCRQHTSVTVSQL